MALFTCKLNGALTHGLLLKLTIIKAIQYFLNEH